MGTLYASIWWDVRRQVILSPDLNLKDFNLLFLKHVSHIQSNDDFNSILDKIKKIDTQWFQGRYSVLFDQVYADKGL